MIQSMLWYSLPLASLHKCISISMFQWWVKYQKRIWEQHFDFRYLWLQISFLIARFFGTVFYSVLTTVTAVCTVHYGDNCFDWTIFRSDVNTNLYEIFKWLQPPYETCNVNEPSLKKKERTKNGKIIQTALSAEYHKSKSVREAIWFPFDTVSANF